MDDRSKDSLREKSTVNLRPGNRRIGPNVPHNVALDSVTILVVSHNGNLCSNEVCQHEDDIQRLSLTDSISGLTEISKAVRDYFELGLIDGRVPMSRPVDQTELRVISSGRAVNVHRKHDCKTDREIDMADDFSQMLTFEERVLLVPVCYGVHTQPRPRRRFRFRKYYIERELTANSCLSVGEIVITVAGLSSRSS